ncbi:MAG: putative 4-hydroxybenzoate polyprenyltransferase [Nitrospiraceae bacterium]|nr:putative 4-hydroxybenzoate polyprenyltransferase [Nitrospiraceae bacterium]
MFKRLVHFLRMIKFSHSIFALPFAFTAAIMAAGGYPSLAKILWITVAMVGARSGAMAVNRIVDRKIDAMNPRTKDRELPSGKLGLAEVAVFAAASFALLIFAAWRLNPLCLELSPVAIAVVVFYSYTKRFTWMSHFFLGLALSLSPLGAWAAVRGSLGWGAVCLAFAVVFWLAGFDVLYALQDIDFDRRYGLYSLPARYGIGKSLLAARSFHVLSVLMLCVTGALVDMNWAYWAGLVLVSAFFIYEHSLVKEKDLSRLDIAFFNMNGWISVTVFVFTALSFII